MKCLYLTLLIQTNTYIKKRRKGDYMKNKKRILAVLLTMTMLVSMLTGCMGQQNNIGVNADGTCAYTMKLLYEKSMYDDLVAAGSTSTSYVTSGDFAQATETINGKTYYSFTRSFSFGTTAELVTFLTDDTTYYNSFITGSKNSSSYSQDTFMAPFDSVSLDVSGFIGTLSADNMLSSSASNDVSKISAKDLNGYDSINTYYKELGLMVDVSITLPAAITESNGIINGNTATWDIETIPDDGKLIAVTSGNPISTDATAPTISGVKNNGLYKKANVTASDDVALSKVLINGIRYNTAKFTLTENGKYTITATDANNNTSTVKFTVDAKAPKIKGLKAGRIPKKGLKIRFSDNIGIKSVKINGKNVNKKKVTLKKAGKYTIVVTDKAGNVTKVKYQIRKY